MSGVISKVQSWGIEECLHEFLHSLWLFTFFMPPSKTELLTQAPEAFSMCLKLHFCKLPLGLSPWYRAQNQPAGPSLPKSPSGEAAAQSWSFFHQLTLRCTHTSLVHIPCQLSSAGLS